MFWNRNDDFILSNFDVFDLVSHSACKDVATLCESSIMVAPPITSILLGLGWLVTNVKIV